MDFLFRFPLFAPFSTIAPVTAMCTVTTLFKSWNRCFGEIGLFWCKNGAGRAKLPITQLYVLWLSCCKPWVDTFLCPMAVGWSETSLRTQPVWCFMILQLTRVSLALTICTAFVYEHYLLLQQYAVKKPQKTKQKNQTKIKKMALTPPFLLAFPVFLPLCDENRSLQNPVYLTWLFIAWSCWGLFLSSANGLFFVGAVKRIEKNCKTLETRLKWWVRCVHTASLICSCSHLNTRSRVFIKK